MRKNQSAIVEGLKEALAYKEGRDVDVRVTCIVPSDIDVKSIRKSLHLTQEEFAKRYGLTLSALRNWEQGRRKPEGPARALLSLIEKNPRAIDTILHGAA
jgi:putative transcriptional regulator